MFETIAVVEVNRTCPLKDFVKNQRLTGRRAAEIQRRVVNSWRSAGQSRSRTLLNGVFVRVSEDMKCDLSSPSERIEIRRFGEMGGFVVVVFVKDKRVGTKKEQEGEQKKFDLAGRSGAGKTGNHASPRMEGLA